MSEEQEPFHQYAIVEVFGHQRFAGLVTEQNVAGHGYVRIDVPAVGAQSAFTKLLAHSSIFSITPVTEDVAKRAAQNFRAAPVNVFDLQPRETQRQIEDWGGDDDDD